MRNGVAGLVLVGLAACQVQGESPERATQAVKGGDNFVTGFESVCSMFVTLPPDEDMDPQDPIYCTCTKIAPSIVVTSAACVEENLRADMVAGIDVRFGTSFSGGTAYTVDDVAVHRYYNKDSSSVFDMALLHLTADPPQPAAVMASRTLTSADLGPSTPEECSSDVSDMTPGCAVMLGFGETGNDLEDHGALKKIIVPVRDVSRRTLAAGTEPVTTCDGDSGGPVFMDLGSGLELVAVTSRQSGCSAGEVRTRIDVQREVFIDPYIARFDPTCGLDSTCDAGCDFDPDCDPCSWNDVCEEDCPTRDWDCELGTNPGVACTQSGECEFGGRCIEAGDDAAFTYCSEPCDPAQDFCQGEMACVDNDGVNECTWPLPSPGSQGYPCTTNLGCRSGICEELICVTECDPGAADPCPTNHADPEQPFSCGASTVEPGKNVCQGAIFSGGGGFCTVEGGAGQGTTFLFGLALVVLGIARRRRRA